MNTDRQSKQTIEARLERSLRNQIAIPRVERKFNAAVWARIEAQESPAVAQKPAVGARWLMVSNLVAVAVAIALVLYFAVTSFAGIEAEISLPTVPAIDVEQLVQMSVWPITGLALFVGLMFTPYGRRLRSEFS